MTQEGDAQNGIYMVRCAMVVPQYIKGIRDELPLLERGVGRLSSVLEKCNVPTQRLKTKDVVDIKKHLTQVISTNDAPIIIYIGGHGTTTHSREHYLLFDDSPVIPNPLNSLSTREVFSLLATFGKDVIFFIDTCFSGIALLSLEQVLQELSFNENIGSFGVISSNKAYETSLDGLFIEAFIFFIKNGPKHDLTAWGPHDKFIRIGALINELRKEIGNVTDILINGAGELRVIPNYRFNHFELEGRVSDKLDQRVSCKENEQLRYKPDHFTGRFLLRGKIIEWLNSARKGLFVVTGGPGVGKSALMAILASQSIGGNTTSRFADPPCLKEGTFTNIIHARQKSLNDIRGELEVPLTSESCTILIDSLDESLSGESIGIAAYLNSISRLNGVRILVATRPSPVVVSRLKMDDPLLKELDGDIVHNLDEDPESLEDIKGYIKKKINLIEIPSFKKNQIEKIVNDIAKATSPSFLFATSVVQWIEGTLKKDTDIKTWLKELKYYINNGTYGLLIEEDLSKRFNKEELSRVRDFLRALSWCEGLGLPRWNVWASFATVLSLSGAKYNDDDVAWILNNVGWYITEAGERGQSVFRLFHYDLVDYFQKETLCAINFDVHRRLINVLLKLVERSGGWAKADQYILDKILLHAEHIVDSKDESSFDCIELLLNDDGFLRFVQPSKLSRTINRLRGLVDFPRFRLLERCHQYISLVHENDRIQFLQFVAVQEGMDIIFHDLSDTSWLAQWASWNATAAQAILYGHEESVEGVSVSPDNSIIASASKDHSIRFWDFRTGDLLITLKGHEHLVRAVDFSYDGQKLVSGSSDRSVRLWSVMDGKEIAKLEGHTKLVRSVAFSPVAELVASGSEDNTIRLWDTDKFHCIDTLKGHSKRVEGVAFSPDGQFLASASWDESIRIWDITTRKTIAELWGHEDTVESVTFSPCGKMIATASRDQTVHIWSFPRCSNIAVFRGHLGTVRWVSYSIDGTILASVGDDRNLILWDVKKHKMLNVFKGHDKWIECVTYDRKEGVLITASGDKSVRLWSGVSNPSSDIGPNNRVILGVDISADGSVLATGGNDRSLCLWDSKSGRLLNSLSGNKKPINRVAITSCGKLVGTAGRDSMVRIWDTETLDLRGQLDLHSASVRSLAFSADDSILATGGADGNLYFWDCRGGFELIATLYHENWIEDVSFSSDNKLVASACRDGLVRIWLVSDFKLLMVLSGHTGSVRSVVFSPQDKFLASASDDYSIRIWDYSSGSLITVLEEHTNWVEGLAFSPNGRCLASGSIDGTARIWNVENFSCSAVIPARSMITDVAWSNNQLVIGSKSGLAVLQMDVGYNH